MTPEPGRQTRRAAALRAAVLHAAEADLATHGSTGLSVERVAAVADVAVQTVYNHFGDRSGLLLAVAERALQLDREHMDLAYATADPVERVEAAAVAYVELALGHPEQFRLLAFPPGAAHEVGAVTGPTAEVGERVADGVALQNARLAAALGEARDAGVIRDVDVERTATALWAALNGLLALSWRADRLRTDPAETQRLVAVLLDLVRHGLLTPAP